jgi:hypothetical protein
MKDSLKDFVDQNRESFDSREPKGEAWKKIESNLPGKSVSLWGSVIVWRAAAIILFGISSYLFFAPRGNGNVKQDVAQISGDFKDLEGFYFDQIVEKKELINQFQNKTGLAEDEVTQNLQKLDAMYQVLKEEMEKRPTQDVKDALVLNLLVRIDLLNQQLNKLDRRESGKAVSVSS